MIHSTLYYLPTPFMKIEISKPQSPLFHISKSLSRTFSNNPQYRSRQRIETYSIEQIQARARDKIIQPVRVHNKRSLRHAINTSSKTSQKAYTYR